MSTKVAKDAADVKQPAGEAPILVYSFGKNSREQVRASISRFKGGTYVDLRVYFEGPDGEHHPSRKGLTLAPDILHELEIAIQRLRAALKAQGLTA